MALTNKVDRLAEAQEGMLAGQKRVEDRLNNVDGRLFEDHYRTYPDRYFGQVLRRMTVHSPRDLEEALEPHLSDQELGDWKRSDVVVRGRPAGQGADDFVWVVAAVSHALGQYDVERAVRRANYLRGTGTKVIPAVAGHVLSADVEASARAQHVAVFRNGVVPDWEEALAAWG